MSRFFVDDIDIVSGKINIFGDEYYHIKKVLRLKPEDEILICDGKQNEYLVKIKHFEDTFVETEVIEKIENRTEPNIEVILFQGIPKSEKMDLIVQKSVELGISKIVPVITKRTIVKIDDTKDAIKKQERWQRISKEAAKQSNRGVVPEISLPVRYDKALELALDCDFKIIPYEKEEKISIRKSLPQSKVSKIAIFIGPEGGFDENEIEKALKFGIKSITLGPRILRTETAGIMILSILMYELGDLQ